MTHEPSPRRAVRLLPAAVAIGVLSARALAGTAALALEEQKGEAAAIDACDKRLCTILVEKNPHGSDLKCALTKTWAKSTIKEADSRRVSWGFGDARCTMDINISRASLIEALTEKRATFHTGRLTANCVVEQDGRLEKVTAVLAPKIEFRDGKADKVWVRLKSIEGPTSVTVTVQTAAQLADTFGVFHNQMLKSINRYIQRHCPQTLDVAETPTKTKVKAAK